MRNNTLTTGNRDLQTVITSIDPAAPLAQIGYGIKLVGDGVGTNLSTGGIGFAKGDVFGTDMRAIILADNLDALTSNTFGYFFSMDTGGSQVFNIGLSNSGGGDFAAINMSDSGSISVIGDNSFSINASTGTGNIASAQNLSISSSSDNVSILGNHTSSPTSTASTIITSVSGSNVLQLTNGATASTIMQRVGTGSPEGVEDGPFSSLFFRTDPTGTNDEVYVKTTTQGTLTGWLGIPLSGASSLQWYAENSTPPMAFPTVTPGAGIVAIGDGASVTVAGAFAIGDGATATALNGIALGLLSVASGDDAVAIGSSATATTANTIAIGTNANAFTNGISIGFNAGTNITTGIENVILGNLAGANVTIGFNNTLVGTGAGTVIADGSSNTVVGAGAATSITSGNGNTVFGAVSGAFISSGGSNVVIGASAGPTVSTEGNTVVVGAGADITVGGDNGTAVGVNAVSDLNGTAVGVASNASLSSVAMGNTATASGTQSVSIGPSAVTSVASTEAVAIGSFASVDSVNGVAIGQSASVAGTASNSVALGNAANVTASDTIILGAVNTAGVGIGRTDALAKLHVDTNGAANTVAVVRLQNTDGDADEFIGSGSPEGVVTGSRGDTYKQLDGTGQLYIKSTDAANTGWLAVATGGGASWDLVGNTGLTDGVDNIFGTTDLVPVKLTTNGGLMGQLETDGSLSLFGGTGTATADIATSTGGYNILLTSAGDSLMALQSAATNTLFFRTVPTVGYISAVAGGTLAFGVGSTTADDFHIDSSNNVVSRRSTFISDVFTGSGSAHNSLTFQGNASGAQSASWRLLNVNPQTTTNTATTTGLYVDMTLVTGGTNLPIDVNSAQANTSPITRYANTDGDTNEFIGLGSPETVVTGSRGDTYRRLDGTGQLYIKSTDAANTGWLSVATGSSAIGKYYVQQALSAGANTITHSLSLANPEGVVVSVRDNATGAEVTGTLSAYGANAFDITLVAGVTLADITVIG